jgi:multidrug efflux pump subunit AcrB
MAKRFRLCALLLALLLLFNGCWNYRGLNEIAIVSGIAVDKDPATGVFKISYEIVDLAGGTTIILIALAMVVQFNSVSKAVVVLLTVPLGLIGAFVGLALTHSPLGFMALLGIVSLAGVIVSHIIVLSDFIEEARAEGVPLEQALIQAGLVRLRAVLVTVLATVGGLLPLFLTGGALWHPLTAVHIFGLLLATLLTLVLLPVLYFVFCARLKWIK